MNEFDSKMTALADEIRELSGSNTAKGLDDMTTDIDVANAEIAEQAELLEQIATALEGKAGGGAEDLNTELTTQENLISQLSTILDNKASGGSSGEVETCSVTIHAPRNLSVFGWGEYTVNMANNIIGPRTMPSTGALSHTIPEDATYTFDKLPIGSIFTFYHETKPISNIDIVGNIEYSFANHETVSSATYNFAMCKCNGSGSITVTY